MNESFVRDLARLEELCFELSAYAAKNTDVDVNIGVADGLRRAHSLICDAARLQDESSEVKA